MEEALIVRTLTGLMMDQKATTETHQALARSHQELAESQKEMAEALSEMSKRMDRMSRTVLSHSETLTELSEISARQEGRLGDLLGAMTEFSATSVDTRKRVLALEQEVERLKNAS